MTTICRPTVFAVHYFSQRPNQSTAGAGIRATAHKRWQRQITLQQGQKWRFVEGLVPALLLNISLYYFPLHTGVWQQNIIAAYYSCNTSQLARHSTICFTIFMGRINIQASQPRARTVHMFQQLRAIWRQPKIHSCYSLVRSST